MTKNLFQKTLLNENFERPPVWFMRQAGRYHSHYQNLKKKYSFIEICKLPKVACEATMGPIRDFDFDAAILFSDLLFPLEVMGMGLEYNPGPQLSWHLDSVDKIDRLRGGARLAKDLFFQAEAIQLIRKELPSSKGLIGFVGAPLTLYTYAVEGTHKGDLASAKAGLYDGRFDLFFEKLKDLLLENMLLQARSKIDVLCVMDTAAGDFSIEDFQEKVVPTLKIVFDEFQKRCPDVPILYYSKNTTQTHWNFVQNLSVSGYGVDWKTKMSDVIKNRNQKIVQGNFDPNLMLLPRNEFEPHLDQFFKDTCLLTKNELAGWICNLGHGILPQTPEENVRLFIQKQRQAFSAT